MTFLAGLKENTQRLLNKRKRIILLLLLLLLLLLSYCCVGNDGLSRWQKYVQDKRNKKKQRKIDQITKSDNSGFNDAFFAQTDVALTTKQVFYIYSIYVVALCL